MKVLICKFKLSLIIIFLLFSIGSFGQGWELIYDSIPSMGRQIILTNDSCYMATSTNSPFVSGISLKIDQNGNILWVAPHGGYSIQQTFDEGYIIAGGFDINNAILKKLDKYGNFQWSQTYGGNAQNQFRRVIQTSDSCFLACGLTHSYGDSAIYIVKTDSLGNFLWKRSIYSFYSGGALDLIEIDNHYYVVGTYEDFSNNYYLFITKLNSNGATIWQKSYQNGIHALSFKMKSDSSLIVAGKNILVKLNLSGDTLWTRTFDPTWFLYSVDISLENGYILSGGKRYPSVYEENLLAETDSLGNILWYKIYSSGTNSILQTFVSVRTTTNNGYIACGYSEYNSSTKVRIIFTDGKGDIVAQTEYDLANEIINIYPNPATDKLTIRVPTKSEQKPINIEIFNIRGQVVKSSKINGSTESIDISNLSKGMFIIKIMTDKEIVTRKFIKE